MRLADVAKVFDDVENNRVAAWTNGTRSVLLVIRRQPGANIIATNERIRALLPALAAAISPAIHVNIAVDRTQSIRASVEEVERALLVSVLLVIFVVFLFLRNLRATAIPSMAVPLSLVGTFAAMYLFDYSIDNLSLMALTIATGFVVDDAIVVTENITRHLEEGLSPIDAALAGAKQIGFTIVSITASLVARLHSDPAHGRRGRSAVSRIRGDAHGRDRDLLAGLAHAHAHAVLALAQA